MLLSTNFLQLRTKRSHFVLTSQLYSLAHKVRTFLLPVLTSLSVHLPMNFLLEPIRSAYGMSKVRTLLSSVLTFSCSHCSHLYVTLLLEPFYSEYTGKNGRSHVFSLMRCSHFSEVKQW